MRVRNQLLLVIGLLILLTSGMFTAFAYQAQKDALLRGIDQKLLTAAFLAGEVPGGPKYYDGLVDASSVPPEDYARIVQRDNELCLELGLQYLWSCMVVDGRIVFTTSTSPSHDLTRGDHARFFEVHRDPHAFDRVFGTMKTDFSSFHNEWGHGRMVLAPRVDSRGRPYCLGASVSVEWVRAELRNTLVHSALISLGFLALGLAMAGVLAEFLARPLVRLTGLADRIARGEPQQAVPAGGGAETRALARSIAVMSRAIQETLAALRAEIRERAAAQEALREHRDRLEELVRERTAALERSNHDLEQYACAVSHDLQQPLRAAGGFARLLALRVREGLDAESQDFLDHLLDSVARMQKLVEDLLGYSRVGRDEGALQVTRVEEVLDRVLADLGPTMAEASATVTHDPLPTIVTDPTRLSQIFQNLVGNAVKFRGEEPPRIHVGCEEREEGWEFLVRDNGIGIAPEFQERVFQIFERLHSRKQYAGTGIGLALCKKIVERAGGQIWVESEAGRGATFRFTLPRHAPPA